MKQRGLSGIAYTFIDPDDAVGITELEKIDWRALHAKFRRRLERTLGKKVVVFGMGEIEWRQESREWQPHYHVTIYGASSKGLKALRKRFYEGDHRMQKSKGQTFACWLSYISKLTVFGKAVSKKGERPYRTRLLAPMAQYAFLYYATRRPTSFIFCLNCEMPSATSRGSR